MKTCKFCGNEIRDFAVFCDICGERQIKERKKKTEIRVPEPYQLPSGTFYCTLTVKGSKYRVSGKTRAEVVTKAKAIKAGLMEAEAVHQKVTLKQCVEDYINSEHVQKQSPAAIRGYEVIRKNRCQKYMDQDAWKIDYQEMMDNERKPDGSKYSAKTLHNTWDFIKHAVEAKGIKPGKVKIPDIRKKTRRQRRDEFLDYKQIPVFLAGIKGDSAELAALLALQSLRQSEILPLTVDSIKDGQILVRGATVQDKHNKYVYKESNKTELSRREAPIIIPRTYELLPKEGKLITMAPNTIHRHIKAVCQKQGLPLVSLHDLRRSYASLALHLGIPTEATKEGGGWASDTVLKQVYQIMADDDIQAAIAAQQNYYKAVDKIVDKTVLKNETAD